MADLLIGKTNVTKLLTDKYSSLKSGWVTLVQVPAEFHMNVNKEAVRILVNELKYTCIYITLSKSCSELDKSFKKYGISLNDVIYIDAISLMYGDKMADSKRCSYVSGPLDIDAITATLQQNFLKLQGRKGCVFLDSVTTVLLYNSLPRTIRFSQFLTKTLREIGLNGVMVSIAKGETTKKLIQELNKLCDESIDIDSDIEVKK